MQANIFQLWLCIKISRVVFKNTDTWATLLKDFGFLDLSWTQLSIFYLFQRSWKIQCVPREDIN